MTARVRTPADQAHAEADVINAFAAIVRSTFTEKNMRDVSPKAKAHLIRVLQGAIDTINEEGYH